MDDLDEEIKSLTSKKAEAPEPKKSEGESAASVPSGSQNKAKKLKKEDDD